LFKKKQPTVKYLPIGKVFFQFEVSSRELFVDRYVPNINEKGVVKELDVQTTHVERQSSIDEEAKGSQDD
jgi:hypothetical protein